MLAVKNIISNMTEYVIVAKFFCMAADVPRNHKKYECYK